MQSVPNRNRTRDHRHRESLAARRFTTERPAILGVPTATSIVRRNQLDVVLGGQMLIGRSLSYPRPPINRVGSSWRNRAASVASTSVISCGEALATWTAIGRPWRSPIAMILLLLPRRVGRRRSFFFRRAEAGVDEGLAE